MNKDELLSPISIIDDKNTSNYKNIIEYIYRFYFQYKIKYSK